MKEYIRRNTAILDHLSCSLENIYEYFGFYMIIKNKNAVDLLVKKIKINFLVIGN